jgi:hypothetical protein
MEQPQLHIFQPVPTSQFYYQYEYPPNIDHNCNRYGYLYVIIQPHSLFSIIVYDYL